MEFTTFFIKRNDGAAALGNLISPQTLIGVLVKSKTWGAFVSVTLSILTVPEDTTVFRVSICSVKSGAVTCRDRWLKLSSGAAVNKIKLIALF